MSSTTKSGWPSAVTRSTRLATWPYPWVKYRCRFCQLRRSSGMPLLVISRPEIMTTRRTPDSTS